MLVRLQPPPPKNWLSHARFQRPHAETGWYANREISHSDIFRYIFHILFERQVEVSTSCQKQNGNFNCEVSFKGYDNLNMETQEAVA